MAWNAKILTAAQPQPGGTITFNVNYYDAVDVGFLTVLGTQSFSIDSGTSLPTIQAMIVQSGTDFRKAYNKKDTYTGTVVNIP